MASEMWKDEYFENFTSGETAYQELRKAQKALEAESTWIPGVQDISIDPLDTPMEAEVRSLDPTNRIPKEVLLDTVDNIGLIAKIDGRPECLRDCAIPSLLSTLDIRGMGVFRPSRPQQAIALTALLTGSRSTSSALLRGGKIAAIVSPKFADMPISELLDITDDLEQYMGTSEFVGGCVSHSTTVAKFKYPACAKGITDAYRTTLAAFGRTLAPGQEIVPVVEFRSSDTSGEAAKLLTYLQLSPGHLMPVGEGVRVNHVNPMDLDSQGNRKTAMQKFMDDSMLLFSKLEYDVKTLLPEMLATPIEYPANTFIGLCKKAQIPQKWGGEVEEGLRNDWPDGSPCTFLDIYEALTSITKKAQEDTSPYSSRLLDLEEAISRIARNKAIWTRFDQPGTVAWVQAINK